ncbi:MAG: M50 family metallopeptidase [Clostridiales bacterium]|nr:M50 family metallopeptidase [Clostridiales bacterium]
MGKNKENKSKNNILVPIIFSIIGAICGFLGAKVIEESLKNNGNWWTVIYTIILIYTVILVHIIIHEAGHLLFGKISGYSFVSFRIGKLMLISDGKGLKLKKYTVMGAIGQCLMMPPESAGYNYPYILYNLGGSFANIIVALFSLFLYITLPETEHLSSLLINSFIIGMTFALMNGIPIKIGGITNDGYNVLCLIKDKEARRAFWLQLYINGLLIKGTRLRDMPKDWFELPENADMNNPLICSVSVFKCNYLCDKRQFDDAKEMIQFLLQNAPGILEVHKNELLCDLLFYEIIGPCRKEEIEKIYTNQLKKYIKATSSYLARRRLLYAYELLVKKDKEQAQKQLRAFEKATKTYPYAVEIEGEREMIALVNEKAELMY